MLTKFHVLNGHTVTVLASLVTFNEQGKSSLLNEESIYFTEDGYKVIRINYKKNGIYKVNKRLRFYNNVYDKIVYESPDLIFIHGCQFMDIKYIKKYVKKNNSKAKIFVDNHADFINSATNWMSKNILHKIFWRYCAHVIEPYVQNFYGVTPNRCDFLEEIYKIPRERIKLLVMGVDDTVVKQITLNDLEYKENIKKELKLNNDDFILITGGKIDYAKNIHLLMQAISEIDNPQFKLLIFGNIAPELKHLFESLNHHSSIKYLGWQSHESIIKLLLASDLAVFPGTHSVLWEEAVGCGIPAIFKYWEGMTHVDTGGNCLFLKKESSDEIKDVISYIYDNKDVYKSMLKVSENNKDLFSYSYISKKAIM
jgi:glycosyltransferase involved in cell wall biosynthesis